jgi:HPr kinase/phosphorylase
VLAWRGIGIAIAGGTPELRAWLEAFLCPPFVRGDRADVRVEVAIGDIAGEPTGEHVECFTLDEAPLRLPIVATARGRAAYDASMGALLYDDGSVVLAGDSRHGRIFVMRVVRELASAHAASHGDLALHASAIAHGGRAYVFVGPKRAGKSTLLAYALGQGARLVANDRVIVELAALPIARGMPTIVAFRPDIFPWFPGLAERIAGAPAPLGPAQLAAALGTTTIAEAPIARIFALAPERGDDFAIAERATTLELVARGTQAARFARPEPAPLADRLAALLARVPCHRLVLGPRAYDSPALWRALIA